MNIIIDAMGGDNAPGEILHGAAGAVREYGIAVTAVGDSAAIEKAAKEGGIPMQGITVVHAGEVISMHDEPTAAIRHKRIPPWRWACAFWPRGRATPLSRRALPARCWRGATLIVKRLKGVKRPAIGVVVPGGQQPYLLLDAGANVECRPEMLNAFAVMGSAYAQNVLGRQNPHGGPCEQRRRGYEGDPCLCGGPPPSARKTGP